MSAGKGSTGAASHVAISYNCCRGSGLVLQQPGRAPCPGRMTALEKSVHVFAESPSDNVIMPNLCQISADKAQGSEHSIEQVDPKTPGWKQRVRVGAATLGRAPCPDRITALEKSIR